MRREQYDRPTAKRQQAQEIAVAMRLYEIVRGRQVHHLPPEQVPARFSARPVNEPETV